MGTVDLEKLRENEDLLAQHYLSLAALHYTRGKISDAIELLELSKYKNPSISRTHYLLGKIYFERGDTDNALIEFLEAKRLDPFYEDIYKHLAALYQQREELEKSLEAFIDAYILSGGEDMAKTGFYQRQIRILLGKLKITDKDEFTRLFEANKTYFHNLASSLAVSKDAAIEEGAEGMEYIFSRVRESVNSQENSLDLAVELKKFPLAAEFSDEDLILLKRITSLMKVRSEEVIFREGDLTEGIYFVQQGSIRIVKATPFGEQALSNLSEGEFFGEMDFIDSLSCSADAIATTDSVLLSMSKVRLEEIFISRKDIAVQFYWHFWKTLSARIRHANDLMKSFFLDFTKIEKSGEPAPRGAGEVTSVEVEKKLAVFHEKGLSSKELRLLATFSKEELFKRGEMIFREGDNGDKLYIILEGEVRISKHIPGIGEEALAILGKGDFFGEMALVDNASRSADARANINTTVLIIESALLTDILQRDVESSYQFLSIICKILSRRLREINIKIYQWRLMSGGF